MIPTTCLLSRNRSRTSTGTMIVNAPLMIFATDMQNPRPLSVGLFQVYARPFQASESSDFDAGLVLGGSGAREITIAATPYVSPITIKPVAPPHRATIQAAIAGPMI